MRGLAIAIGETAGMSMLLAQDSTEEVAQSASELFATFVDALPRVGIAVLVAIVAWLIGRGVRWLARRLLLRTNTNSFATVMSKLIGWIITTIGVLLALAVTFPSVKPVDVLAGLGFFSVALGFAFQDILQNLLAGVLLLFRDPFAAGDQIQVLERAGTVERITIRETVLRTFDGKRVLIPNADVYQNAIEIQTAFPQRRTGFVVGVAYEADLSQAMVVITEALTGIEGVDPRPPPEAVMLELASATVNIEARFWSAPTQGDALTVQTRAITAVKVALDRAGIEMPSDIVALQATSSFAAALRGEDVTPGGGVAAG